MFDCFQSQTNVAAFDIGLKILSEARPMVYPVDEFSGFIDTKVSCQRVVVMAANELCSNDFWHEW